MGIVDTNSDPDLIDYPIPGNDDAIRSIELYSNLFEETILSSRKNIKENIDVGESKNPPTEAKLSQPKKTAKNNKIINNNKDKKIKKQKKTN